MVPLELKNLNDAEMFKYKLENGNQGDVNTNYVYNMCTI